MTRKRLIIGLARDVSPEQLTAVRDELDRKGIDALVINGVTALTVLEEDDEEQQP